MKRTALLVATLLAGLMAVSAIQASPLTFFQQLFGTSSADVATQKQGPGYPGYGYGEPYGGGQGGPYDSTTSTAVERSGPNRPPEHPGRGRGRMYNAPW